VSLVDIYPTLTELAGLEAPPGLEGQSLVPLLRDPALATDRAVVSTLSYRNHAVRSSRFRYIRYQDGGEELYDHDADPGEHANLAGETRYRPIMDELAALLPVMDAEPSRPGAGMDEGEPHP
jgi:iduronate 2-sulfatase